MKELNKRSRQIEKDVRELRKINNKLTRMLQYAVWEEDMVEVEQVVFEGATSDFVELIAPLLLDIRWTVNGQHEMKPFVRALDTVVRIRYASGKEYATCGTLINAVQNYLDRLRED